MTRRDLERVACLEQVAGFARYRLTEGFEEGVEMIEVRNGSGLRLGVCPSRGLDILFAEFCGVNLTYRHPNGFAHPAFYDEDNFGWLRGAPSGLVTTCGLGSIGPPCEENDERFGIHDRIAFIPAREVSTRTLEDEDGLWFEVSGQVRQTRLFGANLRLNRTVSLGFGSNRVVLRDRITNDGFQSAPFVVLYHCNFGWPLLDEGTRVEINSRVSPRDEDAARGVEQWTSIEAPQNGFREQVFFHEVEPDQDGLSRAALWNPKLQLGLRLSWKASQLPHFAQWKMLGEGAYVLGLEPSNARLASRSELIKSGEMPVLEAGQEREFTVEFEVIRSGE